MASKHPDGVSSAMLLQGVLPVLSPCHRAHERDKKESDGNNRSQNAPAAIRFGSACILVSPCLSRNATGSHESLSRPWTRAPTGAA